MVRGLWMGRLACSLGMMSAGSVVVASKLAGAGLPLFTAACLRYGLACLVLVPWALARRSGPLPPSRDWAILLVQAAAGSLGFSVLMLAGLRLAGGAEAGVISGTLPALVALLAALLPGGRLDRQGWAAVLAASLGTACLGLGQEAGDGHGAGRLLGMALLLAAMAGEAAFVVLQRALRSPMEPVALSALMCVLGLVMTLPLALPEWPGLGWRTVPASAWMALVWHALVPTVLGFILWYAGAARLDGAEAAALTALMPVSAILLSALVLGEELGGHHLLGMALVAAGVVLPAFRSSPADATRRNPGAAGSAR